jgi:predicted DNA-binding transcriptional regulator YafY
MRADRLLSILLLLQVHGRMTAANLAKRLEVSERTIFRDMEALGSAGVPVVAERGVGGGWELMEGYRTSVAALNDAEVQSLFMSKPSALLADLGLDRASDAALIKLLSLLPSMNRRNAELARQRIHIDVSGWKSSSDPVPFLPALQDAVWREKKVTVQYDRGDCATERLLEPLGLVAKGSVWYLVAAIDGDVRSYRVSRIRELQILEESFVRPPDFDLAAYWKSSAAEFRSRLPRFEVLIRADDSALPWLYTMIRYGGVDQVEPDERAGWSRVRLHFDAPEVAVYALLGFGTRVEVLRPQRVAEEILATAQAVAITRTAAPRSD